MLVPANKDGLSAQDAFAKGLDDLMDLCAAIAGKMEKAREAHDWEDLGSNNDW